jgi:hypothetical protein
MRSVRARRAVSDGRQQESCATDRTRLAIIASVLYHRGALLLAVSGGDKLDTMPQEGVFMERPFGLDTAFSLPVRYAAVPSPRPESRKLHPRRGWRMDYLQTRAGDTVVMLKPVGFYTELSQTSHYRESLRDATASEPSADEPAVIAYLRAGHQLFDVPATTSDVISHDMRIVGAPSLLSDGSWVWRLDLPHYVGRYHLRLPREFLDHVRANRYSVPALSDKEMNAVGLEIREFF